VLSSLLVIRRVIRYLSAQWERQRVIRLHPGDKERLVKALELITPPHEYHAETGHGRRESIDFDSLAEKLLLQNQGQPSKLVKFMKDKSTATFDEVLKQVFGGQRKDSTIRSLVTRTNNLLHELERRLSFRTKDSHVIRKIARD
jgi:hypothetical protein